MAANRLDMLVLSASLPVKAAAVVLLVLASNDKLPSTLALMACRADGSTCANVLLGSDEANVLHGTVFDQIVQFKFAHVARRRTLAGAGGGNLYGILGMTIAIAPSSLFFAVMLLSV